MSISPEIILMLNQLNRPAFLVENGIIVAVNEEAAKYTIVPNTPIENLICNGLDEYEHFTGESALYISTQIGGITHRTTVSTVENLRLFTLNDQADREDLQALSLAACQLSVPISEISILLNRLSDTNHEEKAKIKKNLYRLQRIIGNMSDAVSLQNTTPQMAIREMGAFFSEILEKAQTLLADSNIQIDYIIPTMPIFALVNEDLLARAIYNLISNAAKFAPEHPTITVQLDRHGDKLYISVIDRGSGVQHGMLGNVFQRYARQPGLEDPRFGLGVGLTLVHAVATLHGGTVLVENSHPTGAKITMTISLKQSSSTNLKSPILTPDIYGGQDQALIELSDILPYQRYLDK